MANTATNGGRTGNYSLDIKEEIANLLNKILLKKVLESGALKNNFGVDDQVVLESAILRLIKDNPNILRMADGGGYNLGYGAPVKSRHNSLSPANQQTNLKSTNKTYLGRGLIYSLQHPNSLVSSPNQESIGEPYKPISPTQRAKSSRIPTSVKGYRGRSLELNPRGRYFAPSPSHLSRDGRREGDYS